jgi:hypothetical protein
MPPAHYLTICYYERWLEGTVAMLVEKGVITAEEYASRLAELSGEAP